MLTNTDGGYASLDVPLEQRLADRRTKKRRLPCLVFVAALALFSLVAGVQHLGQRAAPSAPAQKYEVYTADPECKGDVFGEGNAKTTKAGVFRTQLDGHYALDFTFRVDEDPGNSPVILAVGEGEADEHAILAPIVRWQSCCATLWVSFYGPAIPSCTTTSYSGLGTSGCGRDKVEAYIPGMQLKRAYRVQIEVSGGRWAVDTHGLRIYLDGQLTWETSEAQLASAAWVAEQGGTFWVRLWPHIATSSAAVGAVWDVATCVGGGYSPLDRCTEGHDYTKRGFYKGFDEEIRVLKGRSIEPTFEATPRMNMSMRVRLKEKGAFFQLGNEDKEEYPLLRFNKDRDGMSVAFETKASAPRQVKEEDIPLKKKQWQDVAVFINDLEVYVTVDGVVKREFEIDRELQTIGKNKKVWVAGKWNAAAEGDIKRIRICNL